MESLNLETRVGAERAAMSVSGRWNRWKRPLALAGVGIALTGGLLAAWLLPAPTKAAERIIAGEPEGRTIHTSSSDCADGRMDWSGRMGRPVPGVWDLARDGRPLEPSTFRDLTGTRPDWHRGG